MSPAQLPFLVEGILILVAMTFGILLSRKGKPYGKVQLVVHLFFFVWFATGFGFILYGLSKGSVMNATWIPVSLMGLTILTQFVTHEYSFIDTSTKENLQIRKGVNVVTQLHPYLTFSGNCREAMS
jgi:hypothetical protein